ncbi:guanylate-binding protein 7-like [Sorex fumeus]|uniref:guanylate-binding protein 7-like n=1 Tax=Sorex fumeus TaxID=62283 RepID=UPI0024ADD053|nr:guanylate-binding protein 7-like [Sorex fumeus]
MSVGSIMKDPICLVENYKNDLRVNRKALNILETISQPVVVVAITGLCRTGKSYLMNRLAGHNRGFQLGCTVKAETKGIWMWCVPHPSKIDHTLILLDTEGLGDVEKGDSRNDSWIFALAVLLSSVLVYNSIGTINYQVLEQLHYVVELAELIRTKSCPSTEELNDSVEFATFFPDFIWTLRDFKLKLELDGQSITEDEYLEKSLKLVQGEDSKIKRSNDSKHCIRMFFPERKCFVFKQPTKDDDLLLNLEEASEHQLELIFQEQCQNFCSYIFTNAKPKTLKGGIIIKGSGLAVLVDSYVNAINSRKVPCLENAVALLAQQENAIAVQKAVDHYSEQMTQQVQFPTESLQDLLDVHAACEREAFAIFMEHSFKDDGGKFQLELLSAIEEKKEAFLLQNEEASLKYCQDELRKISSTLVESISKGIFFVRGGHNLYLGAKNKVEQDYALVPKKGVKSMEVLQGFLQSQESTEQAILHADKSLTNAEKHIAAEQAQKQAYEKKMKLVRKRNKMEEQKTEAQKKTVKENLIQLKKKIEEEGKIKLRESNTILEHLLKNQEKLRTEGLTKKSEEMNRTINQVKRNITIIEDNWVEKISGILILFGSMLMKKLPGYYKLIGVGTLLIGSIVTDICALTKAKSGGKKSD